MLEIPITATPSQTLSVVLGGQNCQISIRHRSTGIYFDLSVDNVPVVLTSLCLDRVRLIRRPYLGFKGDLVFIDTQGKSDPEYTGFGARWRLVYLEVSEL